MSKKFLFSGTLSRKQKTFETKEEKQIDENLYSRTNFRRSAPIIVVRRLLNVRLMSFEHSTIFSRFPIVSNDCKLSEQKVSLLDHRKRVNDKAKNSKISTKFNSFLLSKFYIVLIKNGDMPMFRFLILMKSIDVLCWNSTRCK